MNTILWDYESVDHKIFVASAVPQSEAHLLGMQEAPSLFPHVQHILSWRLGHEKISKAILPLLLIKEEQLSVTGERMCTKQW